jgi:hypothetical protein
MTPRGPKATLTIIAIAMLLTLAFMIYIFAERGDVPSTKASSAPAGAPAL